ncbi:ribonuclease H-like domain-containing protein [Tanacetum coccineum]
MAEEEDRISLLPDCLLLEIISRLELSTKQVIQTTTTISKRWQHLWTRLPTLVFIDQDDILYRRDYTNYFSFIDKTLTQCPTDVNLKKFKFHMDYSFPVNTARNASQVNSWIRYAITRNVQEFNFYFWDFGYVIRGVPKEFTFDDELFFNNSCFTRMKLFCCVFNPPNGAIRWDNLKYLRISKGKLDDDSLGKLLSGSPCLETLELDDCYGIRRIDFTSKRFKNLVLSNYGSEFRYPVGADYIDTIEINAPYMLSLTIKYKLYLEKLLLLNVSSLVKADLDYLGSRHFAEKLGRTRDDIEEELLRGLLPSLGHVNEITLGDNCLQVLSSLKDKGFQLFKGTYDTSLGSDSPHSNSVENKVWEEGLSIVGADADEDRITELIASAEKKLASFRFGGAPAENFLENVEYDDVRHGIQSIRLRDK